MRPLCVFWKLQGEYTLIPHRVGRGEEQIGVALYQNGLWDIVHTDTDDPKQYGCPKLQVDGTRKKRPAYSIGTFHPAHIPFLPLPNTLWLFSYDRGRGVWHNTLFAEGEELEAILRWAKERGIPVKTYAGYAHATPP